MPLNISPVAEQNAATYVSLALVLALVAGLVWLRFFFKFKEKELAAPLPASVSLSGWLAFLCFFLGAFIADPGFLWHNHRYSHNTVSAGVQDASQLFTPLEWARWFAQTGCYTLGLCFVLFVWFAARKRRAARD